MVFMPTVQPKYYLINSDKNVLSHNSDQCVTSCEKNVSTPVLHTILHIFPLQLCTDQILSNIQFCFCVREETAWTLRMDFQKQCILYISSPSSETRLGIITTATWSARTE